ncbi:hypothetical protein M501DRAFT_578998 [Patellaria atrata CBS 101060]|uniref:Uncharacterized protein n=1 Tax=Patellaria atrata CBS 101060 TaxID=1346257 RepID=A0A9P4SEZ8_9PEZI|nr:hypothetical protein M501DRAFT_578998 [Patellaria atrata CBS 101060]
MKMSERTELRGRGRKYKGIYLKRYKQIFGVFHSGNTLKVFCERFDNPFVFFFFVFWTCPPPNFRQTRTLIVTQTDQSQLFYCPCLSYSDNSVYLSLIETFPSSHTSYFQQLPAVDDIRTLNLVWSHLYHSTIPGTLSLASSECSAITSQR